MAYFVGNNPSYPGDKGFALKPWRKCQVVNQVIQLNGAQAITMGNVHITDTTGKVTTVDKTWSFIKEPQMPPCGLSCTILLFLLTNNREPCKIN
ncbi:hypothetical protein [Cyanobium sp. T1G-Tous]|uniref:hypothetical protein n=1 Tax=Cyanobium sp. T1G-Tous TaxID=2823722 RepID=UPI0020CCB616|nr:hypothetical protein [Cyanobium sp. T1G-Tous]